jgi:hypothetical protein
MLPSSVESSLPRENTGTKPAADSPSALRARVFDHFLHILDNRKGVPRHRAPTEEEVVRSQTLCNTDYESFIAVELHRAHGELVFAAGGIEPDLKDGARFNPQVYGPLEPVRDERGNVTDIVTHRDDGTVVRWSQLVPASTRPRPAVPVDRDGIPALMRGLPRWGVWRYEWRAPKDGRPGKWTKVPYTPGTGRHASTTKLETWGDFEAAWAAYEAGSWDGLGFVFAPEDELVGIDIDACVGDDNTLSNLAREVLGQVLTYVEYTPSGAGLHLILRGQLPWGRGVNNRAKGIEAYDHGRYFTVTGRPWEGSPADPQRAPLAGIYDLLAEGRLGGGGGWDGELHSTEMEDEDVVLWARDAKNGDKFSRLFDDGDTSDYESASEADLALAAMLAFWTGPDPEQILRLIRQSALYAQRDEKKRDREDYYPRTVQSALAGRTWPDDYSQPGANTANLRDGTVFAERGDTREETMGTCGVNTRSANIANGSAGVRGPEAWRQPDPIETYQIPPFPVACFSPGLATYIRQQAQDLGAPASYVAGAVLAVAGAAVGTAAGVLLQGTVENPRWVEKPNLYVNLVGGPSLGKSPVIRAVKRPLLDLESELDLRFTATNFTMEALPPLLRRNKRGLLVVADETAALFKSLGAYKGGRGGGGDREFLLSMFFRDGGWTDRKGDAGDGEPSLFLDEPCLSILGGLTPGGLSVLLDKDNPEDGMLARFLFVVEDSPIRRPHSFTAAATASQDFWHQVVGFLAAYESRAPIPLSAAAQRRYIAHDLALQDELHGGGLPQALAGAWGKLRAIVGRFVLIVHLLDLAERWLEDRSTEFWQEIESDVVDRAYQLLAYFKATARRILGDLDGDADARRLAKVVEVVRQQGWSRFEHREVMERVKGGKDFKVDRNDRRSSGPAHKVRAALKQAEEAGYVRRISAKPETYDTNPLWLANGKPSPRCSENASQSSQSGAA